MSPVASVQILQKALPGVNVRLSNSSGSEICISMKKSLLATAKLKRAIFVPRSKILTSYQNLELPRVVDFTCQIYITSLLVGMRILLYSS